MFLRAVESTLSLAEQFTPRRPHPISIESIARLRLLRRVRAGALQQPRCLVSGKPISTRIPVDRTPFTRRMPAANSGLARRNQLPHRQLGELRET